MRRVRAGEIVEPSDRTERLEHETMHRTAAGIATATVAFGLALGLSACGNDAPAPPAPPAPPAAPAPPASPQPGSGTPGSTTAPKIPQDQAGKIVTDQYGGQVINVEPDTAKGEPSWEVEVRDSKQGRIEVDVSQATGAVLEMEHD